MEEKTLVRSSDLSYLIKKGNIQFIKEKILKIVNILSDDKFSTSDRLKAIEELSAIWSLMDTVNQSEPMRIKQKENCKNRP